MAFSRTRLFLGRVTQLYERHPLLLNSLVGGLVYVIGELIVELQTTHEHLLKTDTHHTAGAKVVVGKENDGRFISISLDSKDEERVFHIDKINWPRVGHIGALGVAENGFLMLLWYRLLSRVVGSNVRTLTVIIKCLLDQIFFATQQDAVFLAYCGFLHSSTFEEAWKGMTQQFLTTWINDCSLWPLVNFVGFSFVPTTLQPTYMSCVQLFWQIYISSMAAPKPLARPAALTPQQEEEAHCSICDQKATQLHLTLQQQEPSRVPLLTAKSTLVLQPQLVKSPAFVPAPAFATSPMASKGGAGAAAEKPVYRWFHSNDPDRLQALQNAKYSSALLTGLVFFRAVACKI